MLQRGVFQSSQRPAVCTGARREGGMHRQAGEDEGNRDEGHRGEAHDDGGNVYL